VFLVLSAVVACLCAAYVVALTPHLVHHLFDDDSSECPHFAQSQHSPEAWSDPSPAFLLIPVGRLAMLPDRAPRSIADRTAAPSRAPPAVASLA
jgi:hypothetical protein